MCNMQQGIDKLRLEDQSKAIGCYQMAQYLNCIDKKQGTVIKY